MKKFKYLWLLWLTALFATLFSCSDDDEVSGPLTIETALLKDITYNTAVCGGEISGGKSIGTRGVCWSTAARPTVKDGHTTDGSGRGEFKSAITGMEEGTLYYVRAYVEAEEGVKYGEEKQCMTLAHGRPTMLLIGAVDLKETTVKVQAEVFTDGGVDITERGIVYVEKTNETDEPTLENAHKVVVSGTTGILETTLEGLTDHVSYLFRAYVTYAGGTIYTKTGTFTTKMFAAPRAEITEVSEVTNNSFTINISVVSGTSLPVLEYGYVLGKKTGPTVEDQKVKLGEGDGVQTVIVDNLEEGKTYYIRSYAINKNGTTYGEEETIATLSQKAVIATTMTKYITAHRAYISGEIVNTGQYNSPVTEAGVCWSTVEHPILSDNKAVAKGVDNDHLKFDSLMVFPLKPQTKYYVRTYVTNQYGTNYGDEYSFTTREPVANYFKAEGSDDDNPVFNGLNLTSTYPGGLASEEQAKDYANLKKIMSDYGGRTLAAYRIYLAPDTKKKNTYIYTTIQYKNSSGSSYVGIWRDKLDMNADYVYSVSHHAANGNNATNIVNSAKKNGQVEDLNKNMDYLPASDPFVIDWDNESSDTFNTAFYIIPVDHPDLFKRMGVFRYASLSGTTDWW